MVEILPNQKDDCAKIVKGATLNTGTSELAARADNWNNQTLRRHAIKR
jgi:hypothetical protein